MSSALPESRVGLDPEQRAAVLAPRGPVCVLAGAGTGKTRTITHRIAELVRAGHVAPSQVLAVTFTARAAGEMRTRLRALGAAGVQARTFHSAALRQLRYFWPKVVGERPWPLVEQKLRLVGQAVNRAGAPSDQDALRDLAGEIEWAKASLVTPDDYPRAALERTTPLPASQVAGVYAAYEELKNRAQVLDFDDLLLHTAVALEEHPAVAHEFRERYRCFVVDEYQDVTPAQQRVLDAWLGERDDLTVVGDANQTVYSFAGAAPHFLLGFTRRFPEAVTVRLVRDYRSTPQVVSLANRVIDGARSRLPGTRLELVGTRSPGPEPRFVEYDDEPAEAEATAAAIEDLLAHGVPASEIAVLYRVNAQSEAYEQALEARNIPFQVRGGERFFRRAEVRAAMAALRTAAADGADLVTRAREVLAGQGLTVEPPEGSTARTRWESLRALAELAEELADALPGADLARFVAELEARADAAHPPEVQGITLASLHAAKGLEWDAVFLVGLAEGTVPIQYAISDAAGSDAAVEEERRLFYVGVTRARRWLSLSWALSRSRGGRRHRRRSRFLHGLVPDQPAATRSAAQAARDPELRARLRHWRTERARQQKVPPFVVFTDATLDAIAEQRPTDSAGLVAIPGIGAAKLERYGTEVLALVRDGEPRRRTG